MYGDSVVVQLIVRACDCFVGVPYPKSAEQNPYTLLPLIRQPNALHCVRQSSSRSLLENLSSPSVVSSAADFTSPLPLLLARLGLNSLDVIQTDTLVSLLSVCFIITIKLLLNLSSHTT